MFLLIISCLKTKDIQRCKDPTSVNIEFSISGGKDSYLYFLDNGDRTFEITPLEESYFANIPSLGEYHLFVYEKDKLKITKAIETYLNINSINIAINLDDYPLRYQYYDLVSENRIIHVGQLKEPKEIDCSVFIPSDSGTEMNSLVLSTVTPKASLIPIGNSEHNSDYGGMIRDSFLSKEGRVVKSSFNKLLGRGENLERSIIESAISSIVDSIINKKYR